MFFIRSLELSQRSTRTAKRFKARRVVLGGSYALKMNARMGWVSLNDRGDHKNAKQVLNMV